MLKTFLVLGRVSNLPTVWSNCVCAWYISGGGPIENILWVLIGSSFLYTAGMYQNDLCDHKFDKEHRNERPIPSGQISFKLVLIVTCLLFAIGLGFLSYASVEVFLYSIILLCLICLYNFTHKKSKLSPFSMAACRAMLFIIGSVAASGTPTTTAVFASIAIFIYICSLSYIAKKETTGVRLSLLPAIIIFSSPFIIFIDKNLIANGLTFSAVTGTCLWLVYSLHYSTKFRNVQIGKTVSLLLAGIPLLDLTKTISLAASPAVIIFLISCFITTLIAQKYIPAT